MTHRLSLLGPSKSAYGLEQTTMHGCRDVPAMNSQELEQALPCSGYPIRKSTGQSVFAALRSHVFLIRLDASDFELASAVLSCLVLLPAQRFSDNRIRTF
jgi:hypothetical protein